MSNKLLIVIIEDEDKPRLNINTFLNSGVIRSLQMNRDLFGWRSVSSELERIVEFSKDACITEIEGHIHVSGDEDKIKSMIEFFRLAYGIQFKVVG